MNSQLQDVLLLNQAERDALHFLKADGTSLGSTVRTRANLLSTGRVTRDEFNHFRCYSFDHVAEKLTVHPSFKVDSIPVLNEAPTQHLHVATGLKHATSSS